MHQDNYSFNTSTNRPSKRGYIKRETSFKSHHIFSSSLLGLGIAIMLFMQLISCQQPQPKVKKEKEKEGIDELMSGIQDLKKVSSEYDLLPIGKQVQDVQSQKALLQKSTAQLKAELLSPAEITIRDDFYSELKTLWEVGTHRPFFKRQIAACQTKLDLAVVGMGIIRVDEVLKGKNPTVLPKDQGIFINYIKEQVQQAIASNDNNYKAIVFKGLESSST